MGSATGFEPAAIPVAMAGSGRGSNSATGPSGDTGSAGTSGASSATSILGNGLVKALSSSAFSSRLSEMVGTATGTASGSNLAGRAKRPNPERMPPSANLSALRHHGIVFSITCIS